MVASRSFACAFCPARSVGEARPVPRLAQCLDAANVLPGADLVTRPDGAHGPHAFLDKPRPSVRARDAQFPCVLVSCPAPAYAAISEVEAEQVRVIGVRFRERGAGRASGTGGVRISPSGCSRQSCSVARLTPVDMLILRRLSPRSMRAIAWRRTSGLYIIELWQASLTKRAPQTPCILCRCPGWESNPHFTGFESARSTGWRTGAQLSAVGSSTMTIYQMTVGSCA